MQIEKIITVDMSKSEIIRKGLARRLIAQIPSRKPKGSGQVHFSQAAVARNGLAQKPSEAANG